MKPLAGKTAFVTGGASGIGFALSRAFLDAGMRVALTDVETGALHRAAHELACHQDQLITLQVDVTDRDSMERAAQQTEAAFGKVHLLCNNAGVSMSEYADKMRYADWDWLIGIDFLGVINGVQTFLPRLKSHGEGAHIVNTASILGLAPSPRMAAYSAAKSAVISLSEVLRADLSPYRIGVSVLCPGMVDTNLLHSARNRPASFGSEPPRPRPSLAELTDAPGVEYAARMRELIAGAIDTSQCAEMVLHAIVNDEFYIFTHPELKASMDARAAEISAALARWAQYRKEHQQQ